jgi:hypothetical protein
MALVPLKQKITVHRGGGKDEWGYPIPGETFEYKARVDEKTEKVLNQAGEEAVTGVEIMLDRLADVRYSDEIEYMDELGRQTKRKPVKIEPVRMINGKAVLTVVYL